MTTHACYNTIERNIFEGLNTHRWCWLKRLERLELEGNIHRLHGIHWKPHTTHILCCWFTYSWTTLTVNIKTHKDISLRNSHSRGAWQQKFSKRNGHVNINMPNQRVRCVYTCSRETMTFVPHRWSTKAHSAGHLVTKELLEETALNCGKK